MKPLLVLLLASETFQPSPPAILYVPSFIQRPPFCLWLTTLVFTPSTALTLKVARPV